MKHRLVLLTTAVFVFLAGFSFTGAAHAVRGAEMIVPEQRIPIAPSGSADGKWEGRDLSVAYRYSMEGGYLSLVGTIIFADSIRYNYDRMPSFNAGIIIGDSVGMVLGTRSLVTTRQSGMDRWEDVKFSQRIALPPGAATFAFSYTGEVAEAGGGRFSGGGNLTRIWNYPITKAALHLPK